MAENNRNRNSSMYGSDENWDQNKRNEDYNQENRGSYGNASYGGEDYGRQGRNYGNVEGGQYGNMGSSYGHSGRSMGGGSSYENMGNRGTDYGAYSSDYGYQQQGGNYGNREDQRGGQYGLQQQRGAHGSQYSGTGNYGGYSGGGREDWGRANVNTGNYGSYGDQSESNFRSRDDYRNQRNYGQGNTEYGSGSSGNYGSSQGRTGGQYGSAGSHYGTSGSQYGSSGYGNVNRPGRDYGSSGEHGRRYDEQRDDRSWWDRTRDEVSSWFGDDDAERRRRMDEQRSGGHRGKGPKQYQRSADRIREDICDRLSDDDIIDASDIDVKVEGNEVILTGNVKSRFEKRHAEDLVESISGVRNVENRIRVARPDDSSPSRSSDSSMRSHDYTGTTDAPGGIGRESGTTNEIARNVNKDKNK